MMFDSKTWTYPWSSNVTIDESYRKSHNIPIEWMHY